MLIFLNLYVHSQKGMDSKLPSKLEVVFLLDGGASISVVNTKPI